jgi:ribosomal protein S18 acetylase RimI-like enzyme
MLTIREAVPQDAETLCAIHRRSIVEVCGPDYPDAEGVAAWLANKTPENYRLWMQRPVSPMLVGERDGEPLAVAQVDLAEGRVMLLYVAPEGVGSGLGRALMAEMERRAIAHGLERLTLGATVTAAPFYERLGFRVVEERPAYGRMSPEMVKDLAPQGRPSPAP